MSFETARSADGTAIAFETMGSGAAVILVGGAFGDRSGRALTLAGLLAHRFKVLRYDRRGRGDSTDTSPYAPYAPYAIEREVEDLAVLIEAAGGSALVFGHSSGALLALDAAAKGLAIPKLALYEPPVILDASRARSFEELAKELGVDAAENRRGEAVERFFTEVVQMPAPAVAQMRGTPMWAGLEALAHTLPYDLVLTARGPARIETATCVRSATLVMNGSASPGWMREAIEVLARAIPNARHLTLEGQTHEVDLGTLARALEAFLAE